MIIICNIRGYIVHYVVYFVYLRDKFMAKRPTWEGMKNNYPTEPSSTFYPKISKNWQQLATSNVQATRETWENTCAVRMAYALNRNGFILPATQGSMKSDNPKDKYNYWFRVTELTKYLVKTFGKGDVEYTIKEKVGLARKKEVTLNVLSKIIGKKGIIVFDVTGWNNATGHFTLWDGKTLLYADGHSNPLSNDYYFWYEKTTKIIFWELK